MRIKKNIHIKMKAKTIIFCYSQKSVCLFVFHFPIDFTLGRFVAEDSRKSSVKCEVKAASSDTGGPISPI